MGWHEIWRYGVTVKVFGCHDTHSACVFTICATVHMANLFFNNGNGYGFGMTWD